MSVRLIRLYLLQVVQAHTTPDVRDSGAEARKLAGEECSRQVFIGNGNTVDVLYNDALCSDNREVTTSFLGTVFLH